MFTVILCLVVGLVLGGFFVYHMFLVKNNYTSYERMKRFDLVNNEVIDDSAEHIYNKGFKKNLIEVINADPL